MAFDVQSWRGSISDGTVDLFYVVNIDTGAKIKVSPGFLTSMYNGGQIRNISQVIKDYLNLPQTNPYDAKAVTELMVVIQDYNTGAKLQYAKVDVGTQTGGTTGADGRVLFSQIPKKAYSIIVYKQGYQTFNVSLDLTGVGSYSTQIYKLRKSTPPPPDPPEPPEPEKEKKRLTVFYKDASKFMPPITPLGFIGGGVSALMANKEDLVVKVQQQLPFGWSITAFTISAEKLTIDFDETGSPGLPILVIVAAIAGVLLLFGVLIGWWKLEDRKTAQIELQETVEKASLIEKLAEAGFSAEEIQLILKALDPPEPNGLDDFKDIIMFAVMAVIIVMLIQQMGKS